MSGLGRKRASKWDSKDEDTQNLNGNDYVVKSGSYFRDKDPEHARFYPDGDGRNGSRSGTDDNNEHLKSRQNSGEAWPTRSRVSHEDDDAMIGYYDPRKSSEQDETKQQYFRQSPSRDQPRMRRSGSRSNSRSRSRSRSRSPLQRVRRDGGGSYDKHKIRARVSPSSGRELDGRYNRAGDNEWEAKNRKTRDSKYYIEDSREQQPVRVGGRTDYSSSFPEDNNNSRREISDPVLRSHRNGSARDRETQRRDVPDREFQRSSNIPCRYFASGNCRNGNSCRFSHHGAPPARVNPERNPHDEMLSRHDNNNHCDTAERIWNSQRWNGFEGSDIGKSSELQISRSSNKAISEAKGNNGSWLGDMEMSPDWNYGVKTLKKPMSVEHSVIVPQSSSGVLEDTLAPSYEDSTAVISQQDGNRRSIVMLSTVGEKALASSHHNISNNLTSSAPPVQEFKQNIENHSAVPYQSTPLAVGESQMLLPATNHPGGFNSSNPENGNAQSTVSREELHHIGKISASLAKFLGNGQPILQLHSILNSKQAMQVPEVYGNTEHSSHTQSNLLSNSSILTGGVPAVPALQITNSDTQQVRIPDNLASLAGDPKNASEENKEVSKEPEPEGRKTGEEEEDTAEDAENVVEEEEDDTNKKEKDPKGMRAFKFALVEIVKELLKPAWKEGGMNKDAYKNIVKKVVDKVTGAIQTGSIPQTQEKIDHYLSASKPKLTKLVQAYISKVKKS